MILYFSGTGNSRYVAQKIAEISGDQVISINRRLKSQDYSTVSSEKALVFVGPIYAGRLPRIMDDYIKKGNSRGQTAPVSSELAHKLRGRRSDMLKKYVSRRIFL